MKKIYTSYFKFINKLPDFIEPIAICGGGPDNWTGKTYRKIAPRKKFFLEWKQNHDNDFYIRHFNDEVLSKLDPNTVVNELVELAGDKIPCMMCYEEPGMFCHRHLVAEWINSKVCDIMVQEYMPQDVTEENDSFKIF